MNNPDLTEQQQPPPAVACSDLLGANKRNTKMTVREMLKHIPNKWRDSEITVGNNIGDAKSVKRIALHRDATGRRVVVLYEEPMTVRA